MDHASGMKRAAPNADALNALALQRPRDQTPAPPQNVWRVLDNKAVLHAGKADEASCAQPAGVQGEKVAVLHTVSTCPNQTDAGESDAHILCASVYEPAHSLDRLPHKLFGDISHIPSRIVSVAFDLDPSYMLHSNQ